MHGHYVWGWLMAGFIAVPAVLMNAFSISWHIHDKSATYAVIASHIFMLAPVQRYCTVIHLGVKSYKNQKAVFTQRALRSQSDVSILRLFEAFLESAPQLVLQLYIIFHSRKGNWFTGLSAVSSLVSLTWAMTAYSDSQRRAHCSLYQRRLVRLLMHYLWQLFMTGSRIAAFVFCALALHNWVLAVMGGHWLIAFIWISIRGTDFGTDCCERWVFRLVCGFIYIFVFLNLNDGISRWRITAYYVLVLLENTAMLVVFVILGDSTDGIIIAFVLVYGAYMLGLVCMAVYYSYLHPSGRKRYLYPRHHSGHSKDEPQIFSVESPKLENDVAVIEGSGINLTLNASISQNPTTDIQIAHSSSKTSQAASRVSQQALHAAWQSGMISSSSSNSSTTSLASNVKVSLVEEEKSTPSVRSVNSHSSSSSENQLLPAVADRKNDLSKPTKKESSVSETKTYTQTNDIKRDLKSEMSVSDNNINMHSNLSESPTLSRGSWTRLSDHNRQSVALGDFTVLGFDDDSSLDRRPSDCSSLNSQPKSMSPLNVSSLWKDVHSRLRSTIAATIAAATGNLPSSSEGTPNRSRSLASSVSLQDESLTSANQKSVSLNHIFSASVDSFVKENEARQLNISLQSLPKKREGLSSLPEIPQTFSPDQMSDMATTDSSYDRYGSENNDRFKNDLDSGAVVEISGKSPSTFSKASYSSYPEDSTLTASKLDIKRRPSYMETFSHNGFNFGGSPAIFESDEPLDLSISSTASAVSPPMRTSNTKGKQKDASPFTDQELVAVMAKSLQGYLRDTPGKASNPEREGLALTIEDLRISRDNSPESHFSKQDSDWQKSRSASSLFHDSTETSPASSASKMNRVSSVAKAEANLSPNALKQLEVSPQTLSNLHHTPSHESSQISNEQPTSHGLKFIMDSYGQASFSSPSTNRSHFANPNSSSQLVNNRNHKYHTYKSPEATRHDCERTTKEYSEHTVPNMIRDKGRISLLENEKRHCNSFESSPGQGLTAKDLELSFAQSWTGISRTKKLNVHHSDFNLLQYSKSPFPQKPKKIVESGCMDPENQGYVAGQYVPPLCTNIKPDSEENSIERNLDFDRRNSYDLSYVQKNIHELSVDENTGLCNKRESFYRERTGSKDMRRGVMRRNMLLEKQTSDILHLRHSQIPDHASSFTDHSCHTFLPRQTDTIGSKRQTDTDIRQTARCQTMPTESKPGNVYDKLSEYELRKSAKHVADYFSQVLESESFCVKSPPKSLSKANLKVHHRRSPLQQLDNAQYMSPGTNSYQKSLTRSHQKQPSSYESVRALVTPGERDKPTRGARDTLRARQALSFESANFG
ncbi:hypothetical protein EGW08_023088 [Elysia chlorotica]|uniref:XK-related protein n=1 Tax=Elysia chlorotica TaxID=188477 RepID=A0A433SJE3_ELYCH|nr:hypothetical protein EGW08_023088 [Elysia chlorotica]